jgi:hypothetical protein
MTADELRRVAYQSPFKPFSVLLKNGERLEIKRSLRATIMPDRALFGVNEDPESGVAKKLRVVSLNDIAAVEIS